MQLRVLLLFAMSAGLSGCLSYVPAQESRAFADAARAVEDAGALVFDQLGIAERRNRNAVFAADPNNKYSFSLEDAPFQASIGEPPRTTALRASLELITQYASLIVVLGEGGSADEAKGQIYAMVQSTSDILSVTSLFGLDDLTGLSPVTAELDALLRVALRANSIAEARRVALEGGPVMRELIAALIAATPAIYNAIVTDMRRDPNTIAQHGRTAQEYRVVLSNYVVLLRELESTFASLELAYRDQSSRTTLAMLVRQTATLEANVRAARIAFAALR